MIRSLREYTQRGDLRAAGWMALGVAIVSGVVYFRRIALPADGDYSLHVLFTRQLLEGNLDEIPFYALAHPGLQAILALLHTLTLGQLGLYASLMVVQVVAQTTTALVLYFWMGEGLADRAPVPRAVLASVLTLATPIMLLAPWDGQYYFGYIGLANYHNPTIHLLRPLALASFVLACRTLQGQRSSIPTIAAAAFLMAFSVLVKPNYALVVIPALTALALTRWLSRRALDLRMLAFGFLIPALILLAAQWAVAFLFVPGEETGILVRPFEVERAFSDDLPAKFMLSIVFPLTVLMIDARKRLSEDSLQLAWLAFGLGAAQMYLLAEAGDRFYHGNFRWGAQIALFLLFAASARFLLRATPLNEPSPRGRRLGWILFGAHVVAGIVYYAHALWSPSYA